MKTSDYIADFLVNKGIKHAFGITGGAIIHVFDSIGKNKNIEYICTHHEQSAAMAADAYSRVSGDIGVGIATSGPGATNLLTGVACSYFDSIPTLFLTGQVPTSQLRGSSSSRQIGFQETDIARIFNPITKYSALVDNAKNIRFESEKAYSLAKEGRQGPTLLDICDDVQRAEINPSELATYKENILEKNDFQSLLTGGNKLFDLIESAERPVVILGSGVRLSHTVRQAEYFVKELGLPVALTWGALDFFPHDYELSVRDFGVTANRPGNFAVQNADLLIALGTRLDTHETGSDLKTFARGAKIVAVDIDQSELDKYEERGLKNVIPIKADLRSFFDSVNHELKDVKRNDISKWKSKISGWKQRYPICKEEYFKQKEQINPYAFLDILSDEASEGDIIIPEAGCNVTWGMQGWKVKENQRLFSSFNHSPMGYGIPASIGASFAREKSKVITLIGDGGLMMNEQDMATIAKHDLPIKIFVMNNNGYGMIKQTQETWLDSRYEASDKNSFYIPDPKKLARAHGIEKVISIKSLREVKNKVKEVLDYKGPVLCDVSIHPNSRIYPKLVFGKPIEDSAPLLDRATFNREMIIKDKKK